jgi:hypothetical protein
MMLHGLPVSMPAPANCACAPSAASRPSSGIYPVACSDCATLVDPVDPVRPDAPRWWRGGSWTSDGDGLTIADRAGAPPSIAVDFNGMRCARNPLTEESGR